MPPPNRTREADSTHRTVPTGIDYKKRSQGLDAAVIIPFPLAAKRQSIDRKLFDFPRCSILTTGGLSFGGDELRSLCLVGIEAKLSREVTADSLRSPYLAVTCSVLRTLSRYYFIDLDQDMSANGSPFRLC